ncbi:hypothetical protein, partial [Nostoc sp.]|uniref:hypothetical protein n=1 Tax=Nostoc sp. TaxID=1180 RepID=UPI003B5D97D6
VQNFYKSMISTFFLYKTLQRVPFCTYPGCTPLTPMQVQAITQAVENLILPTNTKPIPKPKPVKRQNPIS